jgi:flagellar FliJ protein
VKRFRFDLEQLLRLKRWREEEAKKALAVEVAALEKLRARLMELQGDLEGAWSNAPGNDGDTVDAQGRLHLLGYARHMGQMIAGQEGEIAEQSARIAEKSDRLMKAMQERKALEKLKERRHGEWRKERNRLEYANMDEAAAAMLRRAGMAAADAPSAGAAAEG